MTDRIGFVVMQIGNDELDALYSTAIAPAIEATGLKARRVDRHNEGGLLKSEIVRFIDNATVIVADLTNERPNVYLEVGYAMGLDRFRNLILSVREDHFPQSPNYRRDGPRIHFDLAGYDILSWRTSDLASFRTELERRIRRRLALLDAPLVAEAPVVAIDDEWVGAQRAVAMAGLAAIGRTGYMEIVCSVAPPKPQKTLEELNDAAMKAPIRTFGWPIALYMTKDGLRPRPRADGIFATIQSSTKDSFDYWALRRNGDFYFLGSLFEDERRPQSLFFDTRTVRVTEALMYLLRLYGFLGLPRDQEIAAQITHGGLRGRRIDAASQDRDVFPKSESIEDRSVADIRTTLDALEAKLPAFVRVVVEPLFELFEFKRFSPEIIDSISSNFVEGKVT
jgi:hypothetical protein